MNDKKNITIYLICGKARSGKNTFANMIKQDLEKNGKKVCEIEIMRTMKGYVKDYFGWDGRDETKPRELLQKFATEIIREKLNKPMFHINRLLEDIEILSNFFDSFIVPDVRLPIEIEEIKKQVKNTVAINIVRYNYDNGMTDEQNKHITETALDNYEDFDYRIINDRLEDLEKNAEKLVNEVEKL